jgi:hypothetical protein
MTKLDAGTNAPKEETLEVYDEAFTVKKQRWGTHVSHDLEGKSLITSIEEQTCIDATRWYLKGRQEGFTEAVTRYDGTVGGKL